MADDQILLDERYEIAADRRLPKFDSPGVEAFAVNDRNEPGRPMFALMAPGHLPCRYLGLLTKKPPSDAPVMWPRASGVVDWPMAPAGNGQAGGGVAVWGRRPALIFDAPKGERVFGGEIAPPGAMTEPQLARQVIAPLMSAIRELTSLGVPHRAIRPGNLFYQSSNQGPMMLGECFSMPPGFAQPVLYETIENAIADPYGRGPGLNADDLYALGVLILQLHVGRDPTEDMTEEEIISAKISAGSFAALAGREKLSTSMAEILRGLLNDKATDRWTLRHLDAWSIGQHFTPTMPYLPQRASRPIRFGESDHMNRPALAHAMARRWPETMKLVDSSDFDNWMKRSFNDDKVGDVMARLASSAAGSGPTAAIKDRYVSRLIIWMNSQSPICYRDIRVNVTGMAAMLANVLDDQPLLNQFVELLRGRLVQVWLNEQSALNSDQLQVRRIMEEVEKHIEKPAIGQGVERALYELDPLVPCRSPMIADFYVTNMRDLLPAIDAALPGLGAGTIPLDRHIAAFIGAHLRRSIDRELGAIAQAPEDADRRVAILRLLATVQQAHPTRKLPRLADAVVAMLAPALSCFHHATVRSDVERRMRKLGKDSDFSGLALLFDPSGPYRRSDSLGFTAAKRAFAALKREELWLEQGGLTHPNRTRLIGQRAACIASAFVASAAVAAYSVYALL
jgi:eukaryotic-like serine/threonine-protein kinase